MGISGFIASHLQFKSRMALLSTAISSFVIVLAISIISGFRQDLEDCISEVYSEIELEYGNIEKINNNPDILSIEPAISTISLIKSDGSFNGILFKSHPKMSGKGSVILPKNFADACNLHIGDTIMAYFMPGDKMKIRKFTISGLSEKIATLDKSTAIGFLSLEDLQRIEGLDSTQAQFYAVRLKKDKRSREDISQAAYTISMECGLKANTCVDRFPVLYDWLEVLNANAIIILILMCLVAAFNTISAFLILIMRSTKTIGLLKTLGMSTKDLSKSFLKLVSRNTIIGLVIGNMCAIVIILVQDCTHFMKLDPQQYFLSYIPMSFDFLKILSSNVIAYLSIMLLTLLPTKRIARIDPALSIKEEL